MFVFGLSTEKFNWNESGITASGFFGLLRKTFRKRSEDNYFNRVARFNNSLSQLNSFANYSQHKNPCQFRREVKNFLEGEALKRFKYKSYPSGWKGFEKI